MSAMSELSIEMDEAELAAIDERLGDYVSTEDMEYLNWLLMEQVLQAEMDRRAVTAIETSRSAA